MNSALQTARVKPAYTTDANGQRWNVPGGAFLNIPDRVARRTDISPGCKMVYGAINALEHASRGKCTASDVYLAGMTGLSVKQVRRCLEILASKGLIGRSADLAGQKTIATTSCPASQEEGQIVPAVPALPADSLAGSRDKLSQNPAGRGPNCPPDKKREEKEKTSSVFASLPEAGNPDPWKPRLFDPAKASSPPPPQAARPAPRGFPSPPRPRPTVQQNFNAPRPRSEYVGGENGDALWALLAGLRPRPTAQQPESWPVPRPLADQLDFLAARIAGEEAP